MNHWMILPILVPAIVAPLLSLAVRHDIVLARIFSVSTTVFLVGLGLYQMISVQSGEIFSYELGDWPAPFGIVLVLDRLSALMMTLTGTLALAVQIYAINGWDKRGQHFHPLFQFQLMGLNGAFLTGDLFNLFVFFEILLIASYGLMVHGGGPDRMRAGVQYITVNLLGSALFLLALGLIYSVTGTLNMADFAVKVAEIAPGDEAMLASGGMLLLLVFCVKAALFPVHFWLPVAYGQACGPIAALFAIMTKVGAYAILRVFILAFGQDAGSLAWLAGPFLTSTAAITLVIGMIGVMSSRSLTQQACFASLASMGTLLIATGVFTPPSVSASLYYMLHSTLCGAGLFLLIDLVIARRPGEGDYLSVAPRFSHQGILAAFFLVFAIASIGLPPLAGFFGKLLILDSVRDAQGGMWLWGIILGTSLLGLIGFANSGSLIFWKSHAVEGRFKVPELGDLGLPLTAIGFLVGNIVALTLLANPVISYLDSTALQLFDAHAYIDAVLNANEVSP